MKHPKACLFLCLVPGLLFVVLAWHWRAQTQLLAGTLSRAQEHAQEARREAEALREKVLLEEGRLARIEQDLDQELTRANTPESGKLRGKIDKQRMLERLEEARARVKAQDYAAALASYLWCLDVGLKDPNRFGMDWGKLIHEVAEFAKVYPITRDALLQRSAQLGARALASPGDSPLCLARLNRELGLSERNIGIYDQLPKDSEARRTLVLYDTAGFVEAKRYKDVIASMQYSLMNYGFEAMSARLANEAAGDVAERGELFVRSLQHVEVLAGVSDLDHAVSLAAKVLALARTPEERARVEKALARAGHAELWLQLRP